MTDGLTQNPDHTAIVIVDHGSKRIESNRMFEEFVSGYAQRASYKIVEPAHMELAEPSIATAFDRCAQRGARCIVVCPYLLLPGRHWHQDIPVLAQAAAAQHPGMTYLVAAPIGLHPMMVDVIESRIGHCLARVAGQVADCESCQETGGCVLRPGVETPSS